MVTSYGESLSADTEGAKSFKTWLAYFIHQNQLTLDQLCNADESGLLWKYLPRKTFIDSHERTSAGRK